MVAKELLQLSVPTVVTMASQTPMWVDLCAQLAPMASIAVFMAPLPTLRKISSDRSVGSLPLLPYSTMVASAFLWFVYGVLRRESKIWTANGVGLVLGAYYFLEFMRHCPSRSKTLPGSKLQHIQAVATVIALTLATAVSPLQQADQWIGRAGVLFCILMFASPLSALGTVLQQRSAKSIPLPLAVSSVVNCFLWSVAGFQMRDVNIYLPNLLGLACGVAQVALKIIFRNGPANEKKDLVVADKLPI